MADLPAYFLTWTTRGSWLHGNQRGSVEYVPGTNNTRLVAPDAERFRAIQARLESHPFVLDEARRVVVREAIEEHCEFRRWYLHALNVRTQHVHAVVSASSHRPEIVMGQFKDRATRALRSQGLEPPDRTLWTKMGSTRWINDEESFAMAVDYVRNHQ